MEVKKEKTELGSYQIFLEQDNKSLVMTFGGNFDLYWSLIEKDRQNDFSEFLITKENYRIYREFDILFNRIKTCDIYRFEEDFLLLDNTKVGFEKYLTDIEKSNNNLRERRKYEKNPIFHDNIVEWHCDDAPYEDSHALKIIKQDEDSYLIIFEFNKKEWFSKYSVRISNSGSRYTPYNVLFMEMFNHLQEYDLDDPRIHLEEYIYQKTKLKK